MAAPNNQVVCADGCDANSLSPVDFSLCNGAPEKGEYQRAFLTNLDGNQNFDPWAEPVTGTEVNDPEAWADRMDQTGASTGAILTFHIIGEKADPEVNRLEFSLDRTRILSRKHVVAWEVDEMSDMIHDALRKLSQCGGTFGLWLETSAGKLMSSSEGHHIPIQADVFCEMNVTKGDGNRRFWHGTFEWEDLGTEMVMDSVVPATPEPGS